MKVGRGWMMQFLTRISMIGVEGKSFACFAPSHEPWDVPICYQCVSNWVFYVVTYVKEEQNISWHVIATKCIHFLIFTKQSCLKVDLALRGVFMWNFGSFFLGCGSRIFLLGFFSYPRKKLPYYQYHYYNFLKNWGWRIDIIDVM